MNETFLNILAAILYIGEKHGETLCYNTETRQICRVLSHSDDVYTLLPTAGADAPTSYFSGDTLIFRTDISERTEKIGKLTAINGLTTGEQQITNGSATATITAAQRIENSPTTAQQRNGNGTATEQQRQFIGFGTVNLPRVSSLYSGELAVVLTDIEAALDKIFFNTNKEATIKKYIARYDDIKKYAAAGNLYECKLALKSLTGTIEKQKAMQKGVDKMERKALLKKRAVNALIIFVFALGAVFYFRPWQWHKTTVAETDSPTPPALMVAATVPTTTGSPFDLAIREFETETGKKIYPGGRACLQSTAARLGLTTKQEIKKLIKQNVK